MIKKLIVILLLINKTLLAAVYTVKEIKSNSEHGDLVVINGKITAYTGKNEYILADTTGAIKVYINSEEWHENMVLNNRISEKIELVGYVYKYDGSINFYQPLFIKALRIKRHNNDIIHLTH